MKKVFADYLYMLMEQNPNIWLVTGDLGYGVFDHIRAMFPKRFINTGAAEQTMMDIGIGLALEGKIPVVYSITPFLLYRPFESIRTYINHEKIPVIMVGAGRNDDYKHDGFSHFAGDDWQMMGLMKNIESVWPGSKKELYKFMDEAVQAKKPYYINVPR